MANAGARLEAGEAPPRRRRGHFSALARDTRGAGIVEYIILIGVVALLAITAFRFFGKSVADKAKQQGDAVVTLNGDCVGGICPVLIDKDP
jgi:pilus assembly protein Flp/PilA